MNIYEAFETDEQATTEGVWLDIVFQGKTVCEVRVRSASPDLNPELRKAMTDQTVELVAATGKADDDTIDSLSSEDNEKKLFATSVVTGWKGVTDRNGKTLKCTPKNVLQVFNDLPLLFNQVKRAAYRWETFRRSTVEAALGNSGTSSDQASAA